jgi:hypothetical protein
MATDDDTLFRAGSRPKSTLSTLLPGPKMATARQPAVEPPDESKLDLSASDDYASLPQPGSAYDAAHSRSSNKPLPTLRLIIGETIRGLPYANYDSIDWQVADKPGASPAIVMRFTGLVPREAIITGRNLLKLYDLLSHHRVAWVRELPKGRDFKQAGETVITGIVVKPITEIPA